RMRHDPRTGAGEAERLEGPLARKLAHDLNNLLSIILGFAGLLEEELAASPHRADAAEIRRAAEQAVDLVRRRLPGADEG
ncbi:MAG TPA: histidine kinase dimerization/phospho-acceptor domain-containing protein, partial [Vicinamibacterales bacterium]|nr:histidine kinase dimerization/phospho-acceptor domain-containing protein [Vicinamibacterales bacterium]